MSRSRAVAALALVCVASVLAYGWWAGRQGQDGIWRFNFAPASAPPVGSFATVSGDTDYSGWRGYGWLDADGALEKGRWPSDVDETWESRGRLNLVTRRAPDELARSFASSGARFTLDLEPGRYEVWVLSGDSGLLEYTPLQAYSIMVEGREAYRYSRAQDQIRRHFETPPRVDDLTAAELWDRYIEPAFVWSRTLVDVEDGQLEVWVEGGERDLSSLSLAGDYPYTEGGRGPRRRSVGAINAMVVVAAGQGDERGEGEIEALDAWRRQDVRDKWPMQATPRAVQQAAAGDGGAAYKLYLPDVMEPVYPTDSFTPRADAISVRGTPGEIVSFTLAIHPLQDLGETRIELARLQGPGGDVDISADLTSGVVRYAALPVPGHKRRWRATPAVIVPVNSWPVVKGVNKQFWLDYHIPGQLAPGHYRGVIKVIPDRGEVGRVDIDIEVLPFRLQRPTHLSLGMTYFSPVQDARFDERFFWQRLAAEFADMRRQGFTMVQYTGVGIDDYERMDRVMAAYREAGFERPIALLESYGAMDRLRRDGIEWDSEPFYQRYRNSIAQLLQQGERRNWPPMIINFGDEFTNSGMEAFGVRVAKSLKQIPGIVTSADSNGFREVELLAPEVDILAFNNGWAGPDKVNGERTLLNRETVELVRRAGAEPWLVNVGTDRFSNGYWLWKMVGLGVRGKLEWLYRGYNGMPHNPFDATPLRSALIFPGPGGTVIHSLEYERMRMGLDDLAYLYTLERTIAAARRVANTDKQAIVDAASFLAELDSEIDDDFNRYLDDESQHWPAGRYARLRERVIDHILRLQP